MKLTLFRNGVSMATSSLFFKYLTIPRASQFSTSASPASEWKGGVSMVQGASRGIGLEFVKQLLEKNDEGFVVATCRCPSKSTGLKKLKEKYDQRLDIQSLDVTLEDTIKDTTDFIRDKYGFLNLLINASGIFSIPGVLQHETTLTRVLQRSLHIAYETNALGPLLVCKHLWPLLKAGGGSGTGRDFAIVANLSDRWGSIGDNKLGEWYSYHASKTALNQLTKTMSLEFAQKKHPIICLLLHPGTLKTDLSKPLWKNVPEGELFTKKFSVQKLMNIINNAKSSDNGKFFAWDGQEIPW